jgi:chorismate mutase
MNTHQEEVAVIRANVSKICFAFRKLLNERLQTSSQIPGNLTEIQTRYF